MIRFVLPLVLFTALPLGAQQRPMTPDDVLAMKGVGGAAISPDGQWVAYVVNRADLEANAYDSDIWMVAADGRTPAYRLTASPKGDNSPRWAPDGRRIAFLSAREERNQVWLISPFGGEAEKLTSSKTAVSDFAWSPDGSRIAFIAQRELTADEERRQKEKDDPRVVDTGFRFNRLWIIEVGSRGGEAKEVVAGEFQVSDPEWSPDATRIAFTVNPTPKADDGGRSDVHILDVAAGTHRALLDFPGSDASPRWSPDGSRIALLMGSAERTSTGQSRLVTVPAAGGTPTEVAPGFRWQPGPAEWSTDGRTIRFTSTVGTTSQLFEVPAPGGTPRQLSDHRGVMSGISVSRSGTMAFTLSDLTHPAEVHVSGSGAFRPIRITETNPQVKDLALGRGEVVRWKSSDGRDIEGVLLYPVNYQSGTRVPTMALIHGGPSGVWTQGFPASWGNYGHVWAGQGWAVFYPNVRGSSGYGEEFLLSNVRDWGGGDYRDVQTGLDELVRRGIADPDRLGQAGWSYGGYLTAWTLTQTDRFKAVMVGAGLTNMYSMYSTNDLQTVLEEYFGAEPWDDVEAYSRASAMTFIKQAKTPTLILHGAEDQRVPVGQAQELYMGLRKNDVPVTLVFYPRQGHGLGEPRHQLDKMKRESAWFAKWVLGREPDPGLVP